MTLSTLLTQLDTLGFSGFKNSLEDTAKGIHRQKRLTWRGAKQRGNLMSLRKHYEVTTLSAIVRDELHVPMPCICGNLGREYSRYVFFYFIFLCWRYPRIPIKV